MDDFINQLLERQGMPKGLDQEAREQAFQELKQRTVAMINHDLMVAMPADKMAKFDSLLDSGQASETELQDFIEQHVPDRETIVANAMLRIEELYLAEQ